MIPDIHTGPNTNNSLTELLDIRRRMDSSTHCADGYSNAREDVQEDIEYLLRHRKDIKKAAPIEGSEQLSNA